MDVDLCTYHFRSLKSGALVTPCNWKGDKQTMFTPNIQMPTRKGSLIYTPEAFYMEPEN